MKIEIKGPIISDGDQRIYDWFGIPAVSPKRVADQIREAEKNQDQSINVSINSGGGSVFAASEIYTALKSFKGAVLIEIVGLAASAASVIAMSATMLSMAPTGQLMLHNAASGAFGDYRTMDETSEFLQNTNQSIANAYNLKTGKSFEELKSMMDKETWMTAQTALDLGFIDKIMFQDEVAAVASSEDPLAINTTLPKEVIEKVRNALAEDKFNAVTNSVTSTGNAEPIPPAINKKGKEEEDTMDLEKLKNEHPDLYEQVKNIGLQEGVQAEKERIKDIEDLEMPGNEKLVYAAKFDSKKTVAEVALEIVKAEKAKGKNFLTDRQEDAAIVNTVPGDNAPPETNSDEKTVEILQNFWGGKK